MANKEASSFSRDVEAKFWAGMEGRSLKGTDLLAKKQNKCCCQVEGHPEKHNPHCTLCSYVPAPGIEHLPGTLQSPSPSQPLNEGQTDNKDSLPPIPPAT